MKIEANLIFSKLHNVEFIFIPSARLNLDTILLLHLQLFHTVLTIPIPQLNSSTHKIKEYKIQDTFIFSNSIQYLDSIFSYMQLLKTVNCMYIKKIIISFEIISFDKKISSL